MINERVKTFKKCIMLKIDEVSRLSFLCSYNTGDIRNVVTKHWRFGDYSLESVETDNQKNHGGNVFVHFKNNSSSEDGKTVF